MTDKRYLPICKPCKWYDPTRSQCYDGHLQYSGKIECDGFTPDINGKRNLEKSTKNKQR